MACSSAPECSVCCESIVGEHLTITEDIVCLACFTENVRPMFIAALEHEHDYPVKWDTAALSTQDFAKYLPPGFMLRWVWKEREYQTPVKERVYCRHKTVGGEECGNFFGEKAPPTDAACTHTCICCKSRTCGICAISFSGEARSHFRDADEAEEDDPFKGMQLGKDYQLCPQCGVHVTLRDGCNHIICTQAGCGASFCYICGDKIARVEREHFKPGKPCPRYNQPGAKNAHHDINPPPEVLLNAVLDVVEGLENLARRLIDVGPADGSYQALRRLTSALRTSLRTQTMDVETRTGISWLESQRTTYLAAHSTIEETTAQLLDGPWAVWPGLTWVLEMYHERHEYFLVGLNARIDVLWDLHMQNLPTGFDRTLYRSLKFPASIIQAQAAARTVKTNIMALPMQTRTATQSSLMRVASLVHQTLQSHVVYAAVKDIPILESMRRIAVGHGRIIEAEVAKIGDGVWNEHLGLRLAVEVYRAGREGFAKGVEGRIGVLRFGPPDSPTGGTW